LTNIEKIIEEARVLLKNENFERAIEILEDLYKNYPELKIERNLIDALYAYGGYLNDNYVLEYEKSIKYFRRIIDIDPNDYRAYYNLGIAYFNLELYKEALENYRIAISIKPDYKHCYYNVGLIYEAIGSLEKAAEAYEKALMIDPNFIYAMHALKAVRLKFDISETTERQTQVKNDSIDFLISILKISKRIRLDMIQEILKVNKESLLNSIIKWGDKNYCEIDGDYLIINKETRAQFIEDLCQDTTGI
jgi:tetratricopeptide (TPR) repeat protein